MGGGSGMTKSHPGTKANDHRWTGSLTPISWDHTVRKAVHPIKPGYAGYLQNASLHYGSSHYGGLPMRGGGHADLPFHGRPPREKVGASDLMAGGGLGRDQILNMVSSAEYGRCAWNLEWAHVPESKLMTPRTAARKRIQKADLERNQRLNSSSGAINRTASRSFIGSAGGVVAGAGA